jgi:hypothetical protein
MPYIGNQPAEQFTSFATQEFSTSATTSYTLDHAVTNENEIALFINNVRQQPGSGKAYTATGTALTLSAATASTDTMYCVFLGRALQTVTPATNSITNAMITNNTIESGKLFSTFKNGITMVDAWRLTTSYQGDATISSNLERVDGPSGYGTIGTGMSESSGAFTFPSTGIYKVSFFVTFYITGNTPSRFNRGSIRVATDNSTYNEAAMGTDGIDYLQSSTSYANAYAETIVDVTDTSNVKVKFSTDVSDNNVYTTGNSDRSDTQMLFIRLGDT